MGEYILFPVNIAKILGQLPTLIIDDLPEMTTGAEKNPWTLAEKPGTSGERVKNPGNIFYQSLATVSANLWEPLKKENTDYPLVNKRSY